MHFTQQTPSSNSDSRTADKFVLRLPQGMRSCIQVLAGQHHRSMNSEIIVRLERSFLNTELVAQQTQLIQQLSTRIRELEQAEVAWTEHQEDNRSVSRGNLVCP